jgi:hypothetical protein
MSAALQKLAWSVKAGGMLEKYVLVALAGDADFRGSAWPAPEKLAEDVEAEAAEVASALDRLEGKGLIYRAPTTLPGRGQEIVVLMDSISCEHARQLGWRGDEASVGGAQ